MEQQLLELTLARLEHAEKLLEPGLVHPAANRWRRSPSAAAVLSSSGDYRYSARDSACRATRCSLRGRAAAGGRGPNAEYLNQDQGG